MDKLKRKELLEQFKQIKTYMGVVKITNKVNGKIYVVSYPNLKNKWLSIQGQLNSKMHINSSLQQDWNDLGPQSFDYEVLEEKSTEDISDVAWEHKQMEKVWLNKLQPYGDRGYNKPPK
jgi:predicted nucleotidyltransferase